MTTRVFRARTLIDARVAATAALGEDAVVLTSREVRRGGVFGFFGATEVEIAAAALPKTLPASRPSSGAPFALGAYVKGDHRVAAEPSHRPGDLNALRADLRSEIRAVKMALGRPLPASKVDVDAADLASEVSAIRDALEELTPQRSRSDKTASLLRTRGIEGRAAVALARSLRGRSDDNLDVRLRSALTDLLVAAPWPLSNNGKRAVVAAVGPSGVGKTTTLAKLATLAKRSGQSVTLVTCDTFRVGGVEQVRRYANLLDIDCETVRTPEELEALLAKIETDIVFVDTSGRAPLASAAERLLGEANFAGTLGDRFERHVLLCMAATCRDVDAIRTAKAFAPISPTALAVTKLDETAVPSGIVHAAHAAKLPIALTCAGQRVPEDIDAADIPRLVEELVPRRESRKARAA